MLLPLLGDATLDGTVDGYDFDIMLTNWLQPGKTWVTGDFAREGPAVPGEGFVDGFDNDALLDNWLKHLQAE